MVSQVAELTLEGGSLTGKRQTEFGYDVISAPLPAVVAVSDAINEPRYPSLKGIMGAKSKPQEVVSLADVGIEAERAGETGSRTTVRAVVAACRRRAARSGSRTTGARPRRSSSTSRRRGSCEHARLSRDARRRADEGRPRPPRQGRLARRRRRRRRARERRARRGREGGRVRRVDRLRRRRRGARRAAAAAAGRRARGGREGAGAENVLFPASVLAADVAAGLAARLEAGLNWDLTDLASRTGSSSVCGPRSATPCSSTSAGRRRRGSRWSARGRSTPSSRAARPR